MNVAIMSTKRDTNCIISVDITRIPVYVSSKDGPIERLYRCKVIGRINGEIHSLNIISRRKNSDAYTVKKTLKPYLIRMLLANKDLKGGTLTRSEKHTVTNHQNKTDSRSPN